MYPDLMGAFYQGDPDATDKPKFQKEFAGAIEGALMADYLIDRTLYNDSTIDISKIKSIFARQPLGLPTPAKIEFMLTQKDKLKNMGLSQREQTLVNVGILLQNRDVLDDIISNPTNKAEYQDVLDAYGDLVYGTYKDAYDTIEGLQAQKGYEDTV